MPSLTENRGRHLKRLNISKRVKHYSCALITVLGLSACGTLPSAPTNNSKALGKLAILDGIAIFDRSSLTQPTESTNSHGIILNSSSPYRILLGNGQIAWTNTTPTLLPLKIQLSGEDANLSNLPQSSFENPSFTWLNVDKEQSYSVVGASDSLSIETPAYIEKQGRKVGHHGASLPQLKVANKDGEAWVSLQHIELSLPEKSPISSSGLIQKPFLSLYNEMTKERKKPNHYWDVTSNSIERLPTPQKDWVVEQAINLSSDKDTPIKSVELLSAQSNCNILFIRWKTSRSDGFGFCKEAEMAATPFILNYISDPLKGIVITLLEISGDDEFERRYLISNNDQAEKPFSVLNH